MTTCVRASLFTLTYVVNKTYLTSAKATVKLPFLPYIKLFICKNKNTKPVCKTENISINTCTKEVCMKGKIVNIFARNLSDFIPVGVLISDSN